MTITDTFNCMNDHIGYLAVQTTCIQAVLLGSRGKGDLVRALEQCRDTAVGIAQAAIDMLDETAD